LNWFVIEEDFRDAFFHKGIVHDLLTVIKASTNLMLRQHITKAYSNLSLSGSPSLFFLFSFDFSSLIILYGWMDVFFFGVAC
jgi:hypothetical protein